jgi:signal transduction histidine kinase
LADCEKSAERIRETVIQLRSLSNRHENHDQSVDLHVLIGRAIARVWSRVGARTRVIKCFGEIPDVCGDSEALEQAFVNVLLNAAEAIPEDAEAWNEIRVVTRLDKGVNGSEVVVEIHDSGTGIAPEAVPRVFEPFFSTKPIGASAGTGLGLSVSRQTILDHRGRITVESELVKGTVVRVFLPPSGAAGRTGRRLQSPVPPTAGVTDLSHPPRG